MTNIPQMPLKQEIDDDIDIKILGGAPPGLGMPFLDRDTCAEGGVFISVRVLFSVRCHPWMDGWMNGWKKLHEKQPQRPLLNVMIT